MDEDKALRRARGLLAKAEDWATPEPEREALTEKAMALIAAYGIDRARLAHAGKIQDRISHIRVSIDSPYSKPKGQLLWAVADPLRCKAVLHTARGGGHRVDSATVVGYQSDLERVQLLYTSLLLQAVNQLKDVRPDPDAWYEDDGVRAYRTAWLAGFRSSVHQRLTAAEQSAVDADPGETGSTVEPGTALMLVDRKAQVDAFYADLFPDAKTIRRRRFNASAYSDGHRAGERADLGSAKVDGRRGVIER